jgi:hypothetical protein
MAGVNAKKTTDQQDRDSIIESTNRLRERLGDLLNTGKTGQQITDLEEQIRENDAALDRLDLLADAKARAAKAAAAAAAKARRAEVRAIMVDLQAEAAAVIAEWLQGAERQEAIGAKVAAIVQKSQVIFREALPEARRNPQVPEPALKHSLDAAVVVSRDGRPSLGTRAARDARRTLEMWAERTFPIPPEEDE